MPASVRGLIAAAVAAGVPAGLIYAAATLTLASPLLFQAEAFEMGGAVDHGAARALWTVIGSVALATAMALILTPVLHASGAPTLRQGGAVAALGFVGLILIPGVLMAPVPPGVAHHASVAVRQGNWLAAGIGFVLFCVLASMVCRPLWRRRDVRLVTLALAALAMAALGVLYWNGGLDIGGTPDGPVPEALVARFRHVVSVCNVLLFAALALLMPLALRRLAR
ncbi:MAG: CbtA family protein [Nitrospirae bacterium]|nr:CbtA family protein [Nitrospirota bacterium]